MDGGNVQWKQMDFDDDPAPPIFQMREPRRGRRLRFVQRIEQPSPVVSLPRIASPLRVPSVSPFSGFSAPPSPVPTRWNSSFRAPSPSAPPFSPLSSVPVFSRSPAPSPPSRSPSPAVPAFSRSPAPSPPSRSPVLAPAPAPLSKPGSLRHTSRKNRETKSMLLSPSTDEELDYWIDWLGREFAC